MPSKLITNILSATQLVICYILVIDRKDVLVPGTEAFCSPFGVNQAETEVEELAQVALKQDRP